GRLGRQGPGGPAGHEPYRARHGVGHRRRAGPNPGHADHPLRLAVGGRRLPGLAPVAEDRRAGSDAYTAVDKAEEQKEEAFLINAEAAGNLASVCSDHKAKLIHISTDYVYDGSSREALKEEDAVAPLNVYGWSKLRGEELILNKYLSSLIIRTSWVYSSFGNNFVKTILRLCKEKEKLNVINDQYGSPTYATDLALVIMKFIEEIEDSKDHHGIVNYCNDGTTTWYDFALAITSFVNSKCEILPIASSQYKTAAVRPAYSILDTSKIKRMLNIEIPFWKNSLEACLEKLQP
ncbi:MAG: dTDP-4-dehydrorhamnose reductase, partial [Ginsengibacter sp.]